MAAQSRLIQYERRRAVKTAVVYVVLTIVVLFAITRFGPSVAGTIGQILNPGREDITERGNQIVPTPSLNSLPEITNQKSVSVSGNAESGQTVRFSFNGEKRDVIANAQGVFNGDFNLIEGANSITASAVDNYGNVSYEVRADIRLDTEAPKLSLAGPEAGKTFSGKKEQTVLVSGETDKDASVHINDRVAVVQTNGQFSLTISLNEGENTIVTKAQDRAGNVTEDSRVIYYSL